MATLSLCEIFESQLSKTPIVDGQLVCCLDTGRFYRDTASSRIALGTDIVCVDSLPLAPIADILYLLKPNKLYYYDGDEWVEIIHTHANQDILDKIEVALTELMAQNYDAAYEHSISPHAPVDAEANVIESVQVNGTALTVVDKTVNVNVPTKLSELENDMGFTAGGENTTYDLEANTSADNGDVTIALVGSDGSIKSVKIVGDGSTLVTTDSDGIIVIDSAVGEYLAGSGLTLDGNVFNHSNSITAGTITSGENRTLEYGDTFTIPFVVYDAQGHITETGLTTMVMPSEPDDTKVTQSPASESENYPLLLAPAGQDSETTTTSYFNSKFYANPDTGVIGATSFLGDLIGTAEKAEKLATARTINGTSFDGTENIVTSYWGTSRSVTIGKTTKTVDGSVAMEWTLDEIGAITADSDTVGGVAQPVYVNEGVITALSANIGSGVKPVYLNSGIITASGSTVGSNTNPIYLDSGTLTPLSSTVGSGEQLMYLNAGTFTTSSSTVGSSDIPIYLNAGTLIPCGTSFSEIDEAINELIQEMSSFSEKTSNALIDGVPYYAVSTSPNTYPPHEADGRASVLGEMVLGDAILGVNGEDWTTEQPDYSEEQFTWVSYLKTNLDGSTYWTEPMLLTDDWTRSNAIEMMTKYEQLDSSKADKTQLSDGSVTRIGTDTIGSETNLIYLNSGIPTASSSTVGSGTNPIYMDSGKLTASTNTVGGSSRPVYLNEGVISTLSDTIGSGVKPVYLNSGEIVASSSTVGSGVIPIYLDSGTLTPLSSTVGSTSEPVYLNAGTIAIATAVNATTINLTTSNPDSETTYYVTFSTGGGTVLRINNGVRYCTIEGTTSTSGYGMMVLGNNTASGTTANKYGAIRIYGNTAYYWTISGGTSYPSANRILYLPRSTANGYLVATEGGEGNAVGGTSQPIYISSGGIATALSDTIGSGIKPIYLNSGVITVSSSTVGSGIIPMYLSSGTLTASTSTVGSGTKPIYLNSGTLTASSSTVGTGVTPVYLNSGTVTAFSTTVGGTAQPVYLNGGTFTVLSSTVGSGTKPVYLSSGTITVSSSTVGSGVIPMYLSSGTLTASSSTVGSGTKPIYLNSGTLTASSSTVGSTSVPVYLNAGTLTTASAVAAVTVAVTTINPTSATTYYLPFTTGISGTSYTLYGNNGVRYNTLEGTADAVGYGRIYLGNSTASGTAGNKYGALLVYGNTGYYWLITGNSSYPSANRTLYLPRSTANGYLVATGAGTGTAVGSSDVPVYISSGGIATACGTSFADINSSLTELSSNVKLGKIGNLTLSGIVSTTTIVEVALYIHNLLSDYMVCVVWIDVNTGGGGDSVLIIGGRQSSVRGCYLCVARTSNTIYNCRMTSADEVTVTTM